MKSYVSSGDKIRCSEIESGDTIEVVSSSKDGSIHVIRLDVGGIQSDSLWYRFYPKSDGCTNGSPVSVWNYGYEVYLIDRPTLSHNTTVVGQPLPDPTLHDAFLTIGKRLKKWVAI